MPQPPSRYVTPKWLTHAALGQLDRSLRLSREMTRLDAYGVSGAKISSALRVKPR